MRRTALTHRLLPPLPPPRARAYTPMSSTQHAATERHGAGPVERGTTRGLYSLVTGHPIFAAYKPCGAAPCSRSCTSSWKPAISSSRNTPESASTVCGAQP